MLHDVGSTQLGWPQLHISVKSTDAYKRFYPDLTRNMVSKGLESAASYASCCYGAIVCSRAMVQVRPRQASVAGPKPWKMRTCRLLANDWSSRD